MEYLYHLRLLFSLWLRRLLSIAVELLLLLLWLHWLAPLSGWCTRLSTGLSTRLLPGLLNRRSLSPRLLLLGLSLWLPVRILLLLTGIAALETVVWLRLTVSWLRTTGLLLESRVRHHLSKLIVDVLLRLLLRLLLWLLLHGILFAQIFEVIIAQNVSGRLKVDDFIFLLLNRLQQTLLKLTATL